MSEHGTYEQRQPSPEEIIIYLAMIRDALAFAAEHFFSSREACLTFLMVLAKTIGQDPDEVLRMDHEINDAYQAIEEALAHAFLTQAEEVVA